MNLTIEMHTFKQKIKTLQKILNKLIKQSKHFNKVWVYVKFGNIIIEQELKKPIMPNHITKIPTKDIDSYIKNERSRLFVYNNYEPKGISEAIKEIELNDNRN